MLPALCLAITRSTVTQCKHALEYLNVLVRYPRAAATTRVS